MSDPGPEQRKSERVAVSVQVDIVTQELRLKARTENLSEGGAMLSLDPEHGLRPGDQVDLELALPATDAGGPGPIKARAVIRWASDLLPELVGIEFREALGDAVAQWLATQAADPGA